MTTHLETTGGNMAKDHAFMRIGMDGLVALQQEIGELRDTLVDLEALSDIATRGKVSELIAELDTFAPSITMVGQIKSGKTSLVNAMVGMPGLLPADVNPWTSVVTSLHLNVPQKADAPVASFQFFDSAEWDHLISNGGRIGELSMRAGASDELRKIHDQITAMRDKARQRLGRKFELLLGQRHDYRHLDDELVQRYVCLGDELDGAAPADQQGRFADITKSADLFLKAPSLPLPLCLRDTPGVNDTFLMREQITIKSLRDSRLCVVVLSASQALSSVDMGLIRLISTLKAKSIVIFVNRIDELSDPLTQLPDIRSSIVATLERQNGPQDVQIVFGSAYWANAALSDHPEAIVEDSADSLRKCAAAFLGRADVDITQPELLWQLSGVPHLYATLADRIAEDSAARTLAHIRKSARNHASALRAACKIASMRISGNSVQVMETPVLVDLLNRIEADARQRLDLALDEVFGAFAARVDQSHGRFLDRALESLLQHLEQKGEDQVWKYSPDGLRMLLRSSYQVLRKNLAAACNSVYVTAADDLTDAFRQVVSVGVEDFTVTPPGAIDLPAPVSLGATIVLDLQTSLWSSWWRRRRGYRAYASDFHDLIEAETTPIIEELKQRQTAEIRRTATERLTAFLAEQRAILMDFVTKAHLSMNDLKGLFGISTQMERAELLDMLLEELTWTEEEEAEMPASDLTLRKGTAA